MNDKIKKKLPQIFCYSILIIAILLIIILIIRKPTRLTTTSLYSLEKNKQIQTVSFPLEQTIKITNNNLKSINIYLEDDSLNNYDYKIDITDENNQNYYSNNYIDYSSNIINIPLGLITNSQNKQLTIKITCEECQNVQVATIESETKTTYLNFDNDRTLKITTENYLPNNSYYWYAFIAIAIAITLLPIAKGEKHD